MSRNDVTGDSISTRFGSAEQQKAFDNRRLYWTPASRWRLFRLWEALIDLWTPWRKP